MEVLVEYLFSAPLQKPIEFQYLIGTLILVAVGLLVGWLLIRKIKVKHTEELDGYKKLIEEKDQELLSFVKAQDLEKKQLANAMAENFGKLFSVLNLNLSPLKAAKPVDQEKQQEIFKNSGSVINELEDELKRVCFELMPQTLLKRGLTATLREFGTRVNKVYCKVIASDNILRMSAEQELTLFRVVQEWVNNVLKHTQANNIVIQLTRDRQGINLTIEDDGLGFDPKLFFEGAGNGWKVIQTRLRYINGSFNIASEPNVNGTKVTVSIEVAEG
ncbi:sensor histidine kinase [Roseivirga pacifica]|uniref:sensor histidine kinase n=1 Tax=Roseivirga pacifica TaxID=1267423 RepID=UPI003BB05321